MLGRTACRRVRPLQLLRAASISPAARVFSRTRAHVYQPSAVSQDLFNGKPSALSAAACLRGSKGGRSGIRSVNQRGSLGHGDCLNVVL